jgi:hypothetical protein
MALSRYSRNGYRFVALLPKQPYRLRRVDSLLASDLEHWFTLWSVALLQFAFAWRFEDGWLVSRIVSQPVVYEKAAPLG